MNRIAVLITTALLLGLVSAAYAKKGGGGKPGGGDGGVSDAAVSILYDQNDGLGIWKGDDAGNVEQISALSGWRPSFGPAGTTKIVLSSDVQGWGVYAADDFAGTGLRKVVATATQAYVSGPVWSAGQTPNGRDMIAYVDEDADGLYRQIYVTTPEGQVTPLTFGTSRTIAGLSWNPVTSDQIAFTDGGHLHVLTLDADPSGNLYSVSTENITAGTALDGLSPGGASFSPDGSKLVFAAGGDIWSYELATLTFTNLTLGTAPRLASNPEMRQDGRIIFSAAGKRDYVLWLMEGNGSTIREYGNTKRSHAQFAPSVRP